MAECAHRELNMRHKKTYLERKEIRDDIIFFLEFSGLLLVTIIVYHFF